MPAIQEFAPAKINLTLDVLGKRADGFHELKSLVAFANIGDLIALDTAKPVSVTTSGPFAGSIAGANLVATTLAMLAEFDQGLLLGAVHLEKFLPVAAGLGGGSSDAAAVLRAVRRANPASEGQIDWARLGRRLGSDVPVCLQSRLSWMTGLGESVTPIDLPTPFRLAALVVNPRIPVAADKTARVYSALAAPPLSEKFAPPALPVMEDAGDVLALISSGSNALEFAAREVVPAIETVLAELRNLAGQKLVRMSGGGPTCFALFDDLEIAGAAADTLRLKHAGWWIEETMLG